MADNPPEMAAARVAASAVQPKRPEGECGAPQAAPENSSAAADDTPQGATNEALDVSHYIRVDDALKALVRAMAIAAANSNDEAQ